MKIKGAFAASFFVFVIFVATYGLLPAFRQAGLIPIATGRFSPPTGG